MKTVRWQLATVRHCGKSNDVSRYRQYRTSGICMYGYSVRMTDGESTHIELLESTLQQNAEGKGNSSILNRNQVIN